MPECKLHRTKASVLTACANILCAIVQVRTFVDALSISFEEQVINSHGDHIPLKVRDAATVLFWIPEVLSWCSSQNRKETDNGWAIASECLQVCQAASADSDLVFSVACLFRLLALIAATSVIC